MTESLWQFFAGCFNQDWMLDERDLESVVRRYASHGAKSNEELLQLATLVDAFAAAHPENEALELAVAIDLSASYRTGRDAANARELLARISSALRRNVTERS
jgi:hypothetical protein